MGYSQLHGYVVDPECHRPKVTHEHCIRRLSSVNKENIKKRYAILNVPKIHQLKSDIESCKQGTLSVVEFFSKLVGLWNELEDYVKQNGM